MSAASKGKHEEVEKILNKRPDLVNCKNGYGVPFLTFVKNLKTLEVYEKYKGDFTIRQFGRSPIHNVVSSGYDKKMIDIFIRNGVGIDELNKDGKTALVRAFETSSLDYAEYLLKLGADPTKKNNEGKNAYNTLEEMVDAYRQLAKNIADENPNAFAKEIKKIEATLEYLKENFPEIAE